MSVDAPLPLPRHYLAADLASMLHLLDDWAQRGWLRELDRAFAAFLAHEVPDAPPLVVLAAALASHQLGRGHVCLTLGATLAEPGFALSLPPEGARRDAAHGVAPDAELNAPVLPDAFLAGLTLDAWSAALRHAPLVEEIVGSLSAANDVLQAGVLQAGAVQEGASPLVLRADRLYLRRYWRHECQIRDDIARRLSYVFPDPAPLRPALDALFPAPADGRVDWQKLACALASARAFSIITGGPGTGKTTTVVKLLALLQHLALSGAAHTDACADLHNDSKQAARHGLRVRLAAPTGKAAARLSESIAQALGGLVLDGLYDASRLRASIPSEVTTLHRLLGSRPNTRHFVHHAGNRLSLDVLVIDEASMIDLDMMAAVLAALPPSARLIMLGDKDQLASVEAGAVLGELCRHAQEGRYRPDTVAWLQTASGIDVPQRLISSSGDNLDQAVAMLRESFRFTAESGIGRLAEAVNAGARRQVKAIWAHGYPDIARVVLGVSPKRSEPASPQLSLALSLPTELPGSQGLAWRNLVVEGAVTINGRENTGKYIESNDRHGSAPTGYRHYLSVVRDERPDIGDDVSAYDAWAQRVLEAQRQFQVLCATRSGPFGVDGVNRRIARILHREEWIPASEGWYLGRPVLVTRNDYSLGLMNGDIGVTLLRAVPPRSAVVSTTAAALGASTTEPVWALRVAFASGDAAPKSGIKWVLPSRLQAVETVYAMTVHKSQGSEFTHAALILPPRLNPVLTRELVYTGITRARRWFTLGSADMRHAVFDEAIARRVTRASGLLDWISNETV